MHCLSGRLKSLQWVASQCLAAVPLSLLIACTDATPAAPEPGFCPEDMIHIDPGAIDLGEWEECTSLPDDWSVSCGQGALIPLHEASIAPFCVQTFPFPGIEGGSWPEAAPTYNEMAELDLVLPDLGRRLCDMSELLVASTGLNNWRFPYHPDTRDESMCDPDDFDPGDMGSHPGCESPLGVRDTGVRPTWGVYDANMRGVLEPEGGPPYQLALMDDPDFVQDGHDYALVGGAVRTNTFYAASNFGAHRHASSEGGSQDDDLRICMDPSPEPEIDDASYTAAIELFLDLGQLYEPWLQALADSS